jgi:hypothetical protein
MTYLRVLALGTLIAAVPVALAVSLCEVRCKKTWLRDGRRSSMPLRVPYFVAAASMGSTCLRLRLSWITS